MKLTKLRTITSLFTVAAVAGVVALAIPANGAGTIKGHSHDDLVPQQEELTANMLST